MTAKEQVVAAFSAALDALDVQCEAFEYESNGDVNSEWHTAYRVLVQIRGVVLDPEEGFTETVLADAVSTALALGEAAQQDETR